VLWPPRQPPPAPRRLPAWAPTAIVALVAAALYARCVFFGFTGLDDRDLIVDDQAYLRGSPSILSAISRSYMHAVDARHPYWRPLVTLSYAMDSRWSGIAAAGYHATNVAVHALASALAFALLRRFFRPPLALTAALVFAAHPVLASAIAWIPGRNDLLLAVFAIGAWLSFARWLDAPSRLPQAVHASCFALALLTKETAFAIPFVCLAHLALLRPEARGRVAGFVLSWAALIAARCMARPITGDAAGGGLLDDARLFAVGVGKVLVPFNPSTIAARTDLPYWPGLVAIAAMAGAGLALPGVRRRVQALGAAAFVLFLAPALAVPGTLVLDHRFYLPALGLIVAAAEIVRCLATEPRVFAAFAGVTLCVLGGLTLARETSFVNQKAFARDAVAASPHCGLAHLALGRSYQTEGASDRAIAEYEAALTLGASEVVHNNIAVVYMGESRWREAEAELREEIAQNPDFARAYRNLAIVLRRQGRDAEAHAADRKAEDLAAEDSPDPE